MGSGRTAATEANDVNSPVGPGTVSQDGKYVWNGAEWVGKPPDPRAPSTAAPGLTSPDGKYVWNGAEWQPVPVAPAEAIASTQASAVPKKKQGKWFLALLIILPILGVVLFVANALRGANTKTTVTYQLTGSDSTAFVTYVDPAASNGVVSSSSLSLPFSVEIKGTSGEQILVGGIGHDQGLVTCTIAINGQVVDTETGAGSVGAKCTAQIP